MESLKYLKPIEILNNIFLTNQTKLGASAIKTSDTKNYKIFLSKFHSITYSSMQKVRTI
jgi:hypothetical protein